MVTVAKNRVTSIDARVALATVIVSTTNILVFTLIEMGLLIVNLVVHLATHGAVSTNSGTRHGIRPSDYIGQLLFVTPWYVFALHGLVVLMVAVVSLSPRYRFVAQLTRRKLMYRTTPGFLAVVALIFSLYQWSVIANYDGLQSILDPYWIGPVLCLIASVVSFRRWQLDPNHIVGNPEVSQSHVARVLSLVLVWNLLFVTISFFSPIVNQIIYLVENHWALPIASSPNATAPEVWSGHLAFVIPGWVFLISAIAQLTVVIGTLPKSRRYVPVNRAQFFRATSPLFLFYVSAVCLVLQLVTIGNFSSRAGDTLYLLALGVLLSAVIVEGVHGLNLALRYLRSPSARTNSTRGTAKRA